MGAAPLLRCRALEIGFGGQALLPPMDLEIGAGELWVVLGRNGAGKTAWVRTILGLLPPVRGRVELVGGRRLRLAYVPQRAAVDELYPLTARDVVALGVERDLSFLRPKADPEPVERALALTSSEALGPRLFRRLSEGERQRVLLARIVASTAELGMLDEPTSALDLRAEREAFSLMRKLTHETKLSLLLVTHSVRYATEFADRALLFDRDTPAIVSGAPREVLAHASFEKSFGTALVERRDG